MQINPSKTGRATIVFRENRCRKEFFTTHVGWGCFLRERAAMKAFRSYCWMPPWIRWGVTWRGCPWFETERYPEDRRLDILLPRLSQVEKRGVAQKALSIVLDLYVNGWAHRDFHARNLFLLDDGRLMLKDFETMIRYGASKPSFMESYDMTGAGLESPYKTDQMGFFPPKIFNPCDVLGCILGVAKADVSGLLAELLRDEYRRASLTFQKSSGRHECRAARPYNSFRLTHLVIEGQEAQRDSEKRFAKFGLSARDVEGKSVLDLGCHAGGTLFALQQFRPVTTLGFEYDAEKVKTARRIAALENLQSAEFRCADVDRLTLRDIGGGRDLVLCLAIERHVRNPGRLYRLLGRACTGMLLFEGNAGSDPDAITKYLKDNGFARVEYRGFCDDDVLPKNNIRPVFIAWK